MPVRLNDADTEQLVLQNELLPPESLAQYKAQAAAHPAQSLFDLLVAEGVITYDMQVQLEELLRAQATAARPAPAALPPAPAPDASPAGAGGGSRRRVHRGFDSAEGTAAPAPAIPAAPPAAQLAATSPPTPVLSARPVSPLLGVGAAKAPPLLSGLKPPPAAPGLKPAPAPLTAPPKGAGLQAPPPFSPGPASPAPRPPALSSQVRAPVPSVLASRPPGIPAPGPRLAAPSKPAAAPAAPAAPPPEPPPEQDHAEEHGHGEGAAAKAAKLPLGWPGGVAPADPTPGGIQDLLKRARALSASDLHLNVGLPPLVRVHGELRKLDEGLPPLQPEDTVRLIKMALTPEQWAYFDRTGDLDFSYSFAGGGRYRTNVLRQRNGDDFASRIIGERICMLEELGIPVLARRLTEFAQGLVLVTGPSGHGKTTTMMALVEMVNQGRPDHIITVEEPIEYLIEGKKCHVSQREVGPHTLSFAAALKAALRENPDIIVIGELRDYETTSMAISAAETGHLVFASLPTQDAAKTIDKVLDYFPPEEQQQIRLMVSESLRGILSQLLIRKKDGTGRVAAVELLFNSVAVGNIIREANTAGLVNAMQLGKNQGMVLMDDSLLELATKGVISGEDAYLRAANKVKFKAFEPKPQDAASAAPGAPGAPGGRPPGMAAKPAGPGAPGGLSRSGLPGRR